MESASSCGPQENSQPPPPAAQAPNPMRVICRSELPSFLVCTIACLSRSFARLELAFLFGKHFRRRLAVWLVCDEGGVEADCLPVRIRKNKLLRACGKSGSGEGESVHVLDIDRDVFSAEHKLRA